MAMPNSWSNISKKISGTTPAMLKNIFYSHAMSSIKKILANVSLSTCDEIDRIRINYFLILASEYMQYNLVNTLRNDHFMKLLNKYNINMEALDKYAIDNAISKNRDSIKKKIYELLNTDYVPYADSSRKCMFNNALVLPIDSNKKLREPLLLGSHKKKCMLHIDMVEALNYYLEFPIKNDSTTICVLLKGSQSS